MRQYIHIEIDPVSDEMKVPTDAVGLANNETYGHVQSRNTDATV